MFPNERFPCSACARRRRRDLRSRRRRLCSAPVLQLVWMHCENRGTSPSLSSAGQVSWQKGFPLQSSMHFFCSLQPLSSRAGTRVLVAALRPRKTDRMVVDRRRARGPAVALTSALPEEVVPDEVPFDHRWCCSWCVIVAGAAGRSGEQRHHRCLAQCIQPRWQRSARSETRDENV